MWSANSYLSAYDRHKKLINDYLLLKGTNIKSIQRDTSRDKTDHDVIREHHKFLWDDDEESPETWEARLAKKYYDKLFKEYCICDLTYYKYNKVAMRWRTENEVVIGKGQFECGSKKCNVKEGLRTWEVNFGYTEHDEKKNALVKLRLCPNCSTKLNYKTQKREIKRNKGLKRLQKGVIQEGPNKAIEQATQVDDANPEVEIKVEPPSERSESSECTSKDETEIWKAKQAETDKSREDEFEEYLADLLL